MRLTRIFIDQSLVTDRVIQLPEQASEHVTRVLRLGVDHPLILFNGDGYEYDAVICSLAKRAAGVKITDKREINRESPLRITLAQAIARGEKMDFILQKATELGATGVIPLITERTEVRLEEGERVERRMAHWRNVIASSCEQSGRARVPTLSEPQKLANWASGFNNSPELRLVLHPDTSQSLRELGALPKAITLVIGPEGGFSDQDLAILHAAHFSCIRLGVRILRTETAGLAAIAALNALAGDF